MHNVREIRETSNLSKALFSVAIMCLVFLFSSQSVAKSDAQSSLVANYANVDFSCLELSLDGDDSSDPYLNYKNNLACSLHGQKAVIASQDFVYSINSYFINVRAPPLY